MPTSASKAQYMQNKLSPILEKMVVTVLKDMPDDVETFMLDWVRQNKPVGEEVAIPQLVDPPTVVEAPSAEEDAPCAQAKSSVRNSLLGAQGLTSDSPEVLANVVTADWNVAIDSRVDYVDHKTNKRMVQDIDSKVVHGHSADAEVDTSATHRKSDHEDQVTAGSGIAREVIMRSKALSVTCADEPDIMHDQWVLSDGKVVLEEMFGGSDGLLDKVNTVAEELVEILKRDASLNKVSAPVKVFGDIHGHYRDVLLFFHHYGWPSETSPNYIFNGDWVDRGAHQLECLMLIYSLKVCYPGKIFLNRGNHEDIMINKHMGSHGFMGSCIKAFQQGPGSELFQKLAHSFEYLPLGSVVEGKILVVHGGIGDGNWDLSHLEGVNRPVDSRHMQHDLVIYNALWSDPVDEDQRRSFGVHNSPRDGHAGLVHQFGADVTEKFCARNGLGMIIRSHEAEVEGDGYEVMHNGKCMRVFSARDYEEEENDGSMLSIEKVPVAKSLYVRAQMLQSVVKKHKKGSH